MAELFGPSNVNRTESQIRYHVYENFFSESFYRSLCAEFQERLSFGLSEKHDPLRFSRSYVRAAPGELPYDAYLVRIPSRVRGAASIFYSMELFEFFAKEFGIPLTRDVSASFHHHLINSRDGFIHNDFHICNFFNRPRTNGINAFFGETSYQGEWDPNPNVHHPYRAIALLLYLCNSEWQEGDGGETGFFENRQSISPFAKIPPVNNSLLAFEVGPNSFHAFLSNVRHERNAVVMWYHAEPEWAFKKFGVYPTRYRVSSEARSFPASL